MTKTTCAKFTLTLAIFIVLNLVSSHLLLAQLTRVDDPQSFSEVDIYVDSQGVEYASAINLKFSEAVLTSPTPEAKPGLRDVPSRYEELSSALTALADEYGDFVFEKRFPWALPGGNPVRHRDTGETVYTSDYSQVYVLRFEKPVPFNSIATVLSEIDVVKFAEGPVRGTLLDSGRSLATEFSQTSAPIASSPDDWAYINGHQWYLPKVGAEKAWDHSTGQNIKIAITDSWNSSINQVHDDLNGRLVKHSGNSFGGHGTKVSGMAGAITNNGSWHASLGWNVELEGYRNGYPGIVDALIDGADVINCSWVSGASNFLEDAVYDALNAGVVVSAGAGNGTNNVPTGSVQYPAAYNFPSARYPNLSAQVIAVAASDENDKYLDYCTQDSNGTWVPDQCPYNYSPGVDPIGDPTNSFIDVSGPGISVKVLISYYDATNTLKHSHITNSGTSFATPMVSALAALMKSVNASLTPSDVYEVITRSAEKVGQNSYDTNGWNQYFGYGRINAGNAVCSVASTCALDPPTNLAVTNAGNIGQMPNLSWVAPLGVIDHYKIYRQDPGSTSWVNIGTSTTTNYTDRGVVIATKTGSNAYYYRVAAVDYGLTETSPSNQVSIWGETSYKNGGIAAAEQNLPSTFRLGQNYPNPFNPSTEIRFDVPEASHVSLVVYDAMGREVATLADGQMEAGYRSVAFDASNLPSGVYLYRLDSESFSQSRRMVLLK